ncbi:MAG: AAA family ATPase, partial [Bacilli bacterium]
MNIKIDSFRSIKSADLFLPENKYIVIYGNNGIGKTTFVKAISSFFNGEDLEKHRSFYDEYSDPFVEINIKAGFYLFDEDYINSVVIKGNNFINDAYEIIIKTPEIIELEASINEKFN